MPDETRLRKVLADARMSVRDFDATIAAARELMAKAWDEGNRHESEYLDTWGQFDPDPVNPYRVIPPGLLDPSEPA